MISSCLSEGNTQEARSELTEIPSVAAEYMDANWYHAMSYVKDENASQARTEMQKIADQGDHFYMARAKEVLEVLEVLE